LPQVRQSISEAAQTRLERVTAEPVALLAAAVAHLHGAAWLVDDEATDAIHLRLAHEPLGVSDRSSQRARPVVRDELRDDGRKHVAMIPSGLFLDLGDASSIGRRTGRSSVTTPGRHASCDDAVSGSIATDRPARARRVTPLRGQL
jgi:hypothetical protein